jgi:endogenous inhibitor of DNA gyrase (YacG/DUF329 family)
MRCPTCRQELPPEGCRYEPFCSRRCKLVDLGKWLDGSYSIPAEPASPEDIIREQEGGEN